MKILDGSSGNQNSHRWKMSRWRIEMMNKSFDCDFRRVFMMLSSQEIVQVDMLLDAREHIDSMLLNGVR